MPKSCPLDPLWLLMVLGSFSSPCYGYSEGGRRRAPVKRFAPGVAALGDYQRSWFRPDLLAGVTVWAMLVRIGRASCRERV